MTTVRHTFQSAKSDGGDASLVKPSDWNADHTVIDAVEGLFGTPDTEYDFSTTDLSAFTSFGSPDTFNANTTVPGKLYLSDNDGSFCGGYAAMSNPGTAIVKVSDCTVETNYQWVGLAIGDSTFSNFVLGAIRFEGGRGLRGIRRPSDSQFGPVIFGYVSHSPLYFGIRVASSTDVTYYGSRTGELWFPIASNDNPGFTVSKVAPTVGVFGGGPQVTGIYDYLRIWNSAKTFLT